MFGQLDRRSFLGFRYRLTNLSFRIRFSPRELILNGWAALNCVRVPSYCDHPTTTGHWMPRYVDAHTHRIQLLGRAAPVHQEEDGAGPRRS